MGKKTVKEVQKENHDHFMEGGPRLSYGYGIYVVAKDLKAGRVLHGGLGAMGLGEMWFDLDLSHDSQLPGWEEAPERTAPTKGNL